MKTIKAQVSIEFLTYSIIFLIAMGSMLAIIVLLGNDQVRLQKFNVVKGMTNEIASSVLFAYSMGSNFEYKLKIDKKLNGENYVIKLIKHADTGSIIVEQGDLTYSVVTPPIVYNEGSNVGPIKEQLTGMKIGVEIHPESATDGYLVFRVSTTPGNIEVSLE